MVPSPSRPVLDHKRHLLAFAYSLLPRRRPLQLSPQVRDHRPAGLVAGTGSPDQPAAQALRWCSAGFRILSLWFRSYTPWLAKRRQRWRNQTQRRHGGGVWVMDSGFLDHYGIFFMGVYHEDTPEADSQPESFHRRKRTIIEYLWNKKKTAWWTLYVPGPITPQDASSMMV